MERGWRGERGRDRIPSPPFPSLSPSFLSDDAELKQRVSINKLFHFFLLQMAMLKSEQESIDMSKAMMQSLQVRYPIPTPLPSPPSPSSSYRNHLILLAVISKTDVIFFFFVSRTEQNWKIGVNIYCCRDVQWEENI